MPVCGALLSYSNDGFDMLANGLHKDLTYFAIKKVFLQHKEMMFIHVLCIHKNKLMPGV